MQIFDAFKSLVVEELQRLIPDDTPVKENRLKAISIERPRDRAHGELATNAAIICARDAGMRPRDLAGKLAEAIAAGEMVKSAEVAGPGFVNLVLQPGVWNMAISTALEERRNYGRMYFGNGKHVNVEFVSANPTGPLHIGHARGAVYGDALARLLEFTGHRVTREYYVNDGGVQVDTLARSTFLRYLEANGHQVEFQPDAYTGNYLIEVGQKLKADYGASLADRPEDEWIGISRDCAVADMMETIRNDLASLGIEMDTYFHESTLVASKRIDEAIERLGEKGLIYRGTISPPRGRSQEGWEAREQLLFRSTDFGDDIDRPIMKADGDWTYFAPDMAYHYDKLQRGYDELINVFGSDHGGYVKRLKAVVAALSDHPVPFDIKLIQLVNVVSGSGTRRMSKRSGNFVRLSEAVDKVGPDVTRFVMLMRRNDATLDFDFEQVREQSRDNPVFYVQYAHARVCSLVRRAVEMGMNVDDDTLLLTRRRQLDHPAQLALMQKVAEWPRCIQQASRKHEPHRIVFYLTELAAEFHGLWTRAGEYPELRVLQEDDEEGTIARIALSRSVAIVISAGLDILGVTPVREM